MSRDPMSQIEAMHAFDFELEEAALKGDLEAQIELDRRQEEQLRRDRESVRIRTEEDAAIAAAASTKELNSVYAEKSSQASIKMGNGNTGWECNVCGSNQNGFEQITEISIAVFDYLGIVDWKFEYPEDSWAYDQNSIMECDNCENLYIAFTD